MNSKTLAKTGLGLIIGVALLFIVAGLLLSRGKTLGERHKAVPYQQFDFGDTSARFEDYISYAEDLLRSVRVEEPVPAVVNNLAPFILEPAASCPREPDGRFTRGAVVTHGLIDSPYSMIDFAEHLQAQCFYVLGVLLPDHGLRPGNFVESHWEDWRAAVHFAAQQLAARTASMFLVGHSAGGALSLLEATQNPAVDGLILFAPALAISGAAKYAQAVALIGKVFDKAAWMDVEPDEAVYRYESFPFVAAAEMWSLTKDLEAALADNPPQVPVFTVASMEDNTVSVDAMLAYMGSNTHAASHTLLYSQHPVDAPDDVEVVISNLPEQDILSLSHLGLMTPPSHPWFGRDGAYRTCDHYDSASESYRRCKAGERDFYGEVTRENLEMGVVERIAFNPFYEAMLEKVDRFIESTQ